MMDACPHVENKKSLFGAQADSLRAIKVKMRNGSTQQTRLSKSSVFDENGDVANMRATDLILSIDFTSLSTG